MGVRLYGANAGTDSTVVFRCTVWLGGTVDLRWWEQMWKVDSFYYCFLLFAGRKHVSDNADERAVLHCCRHALFVA